MPTLSAHKVAGCRWLSLLLLILSVFTALSFSHPQIARAQSPDATKTDEISDDNDSDNQADAGDTLQYTIIVTNSTGITFTTVVVSDTVDPNTTVVPGSLRITPVGINDSYAAIGNTQIAITATLGLLANDLDADAGGDNVFPWNTGLTVASFSPTSTNGGTVSVSATGSFTYTPPVGFEGADSFTYTVQDPHGLRDSGTVTIQVSDMIFYVNNTAAPGGDGRSISPFNALSSVTGATGLDEVGDIIFVYQGSGNYDGGITLLNDQRLIGQGVNLATTAGLTPLPLGTTLPPATANPNLANSGGNGVTLAQNNDLYGFTVGSNSANNAISGSSFGTLDVGAVTINSAGGALNLVTGAFGTVNFTSITSTGGSSNINLSTVTGSANLGTGALSGAANASFVVNAGTVSTIYSGNITQANNAALVQITGGHTTGTITFQTGTLSATNGAGLLFDNADSTTSYNFNGTTTLTNLTTGIVITNTSGGTFNFGTNTSITNPTGDAFRLWGGTAAVTYSGRMAKNNAGALVTVGGTHATGAVLFQTGALTATNGTGLQFADADSTYTFNGVVTLGGGDAGIDILSGSGGTFSFSNNGNTLTSPSGTAFNLDSGSANVTYNGNITQASNAALVSISAHTAGTITFQNGTLSATNGSGLQFDNADSTTSYNFNGTTTLNGGNAGIDILNGSSGTFTFGNNASVTHAAAGTAFNLLDSNATVTYNGSIDDSNGFAVDINNHDANIMTFQTGSIVSSGANAQGVRVSNSNGGTVNFNNSTKTLNTAGNAAVTLSSNGSSTINFGNGGLDIDTTSGTGFSATGGGTVTVGTGTNANTIDSTAGNALNVASTTIGGGGLTFRRISANGGTNGIVLNSTGTSGGLTVTGDGTGAANGSGGVIQNMSGSAISLTSARNVSLTQLNVSNTGTHGINVSSVTNFTYQDATVVNAADGNDEQAFNLLNLFGSSLIEDVILDDIQEDGIQVRQNSTDDGTADTLTIRRLNVQDHQAGFGEAGIEIQTDLASTISILVDDSDFAINTNAIMGVAMSTAASHTGNSTVTVQNSTFNGANSFGSGSIQALGGGSGTANYIVTGNTITNTKFTGILINNDDTGTTNATVTGNTIDGGPTNNGNGISMRQDQNGTMRALISGNTITQLSANGIYLQAQDNAPDDANRELEVTVTNNTNTVPTGGFGAGLLLEVGTGDPSLPSNNDVCANISGNNFNGTNTTAFFDFDITFQLNDTTGASLLITQASAAALSSANNGDQVSTFANPPNTITFNGGTCATP